MEIEIIEILTVLFMIAIFIVHLRWHRRPCHKYKNPPGSFIISKGEECSKD